MSEEVQDRIDKMIKKSEVILNAEPLTNEQWLKSFNTKELAKWIRRKTHGNDEYNEEVELAWERWLKEKHHDSVQG